MKAATRERHAAVFIVVGSPRFKVGPVQGAVLLTGAAPRRTMRPPRGPRHGVRAANVSSGDRL